MVLMKCLNQFLNDLVDAIEDVLKDSRIMLIGSKLQRTSGKGYIIEGLTDSLLKCSQFLTILNR